jgi:hypothetical protein
LNAIAIHLNILLNLSVLIAMKALITSFLISLSVVCYSQTGNYFLTHYSPSEERFDYLCYDIAQDAKGVMYFATRAGVMEFDGRDWELLPGGAAVYSLQIDDEGQGFWAGAKGFGKIAPDRHGFQQLTPLSDSTVTNAFQALVVESLVYFLTEEAVFVYDESARTTTLLKPLSKGESFRKLFELFGSVYVNSDHGIFKIEQNKVVQSSLTFDGDVIFSSKLDDTYVLGTSENKVFSIGKGLKPKPIVLQDQSYVDASVIVSGAWLNRQILALGTLRGGVIFVNPINGVTQEISNYATGLPDNEVFYLSKDINQNIWAAHDYGFTRIAPFMPLRSFSHYDGLNGNLLCATSVGDNLYVGTSLGLYKLEQVPVYDELVYFVEVPVQSKSTKKSSTPAPESTAPAAKPAADSKKGLFGFLKKKKNTEPVQVQPGAEPIEAKEEKTAYRREKRTQRTLRASHYQFKKVQGVDSKVTNLVQLQNKLLASGVGGLYEVTGLTSKKLMDEPIRFLYAPSRKDFLIVSTYNDEVRTLRFVGNAIENSSLFSNLDDQVHFVFENGERELWLCGNDRIYRLEAKGSDVRHKQTIPVVQRNADKTIGSVVNGEIVLTSADGFFVVDRKAGALNKIDSLPAPSQYFANSGGLLYRDNHGWKFIGNDTSGKNYQLLNVFDDIRFITAEANQQNLWMISGTNELFKFYGERVAPFEREFPLFLKSVINQEKKIVNLSEIHMDQEHSDVTFKVVQPDYVNPEGLEFRFMLEGMNSTWSDWSANNNVIPFHYLPTGDYKLHVQAKNIFGKITELQPISFEVEPPYWKQPWFYAMEFSVFAMLVLLSFRLSTRYRIVSRLLSLLTIILLIEFIQTAIGSSLKISGSPVIEFLIQVVVALLVLPVEGYLRNVMLRSLDSSHKFYQYIVPNLKIKEKPERFIKETSDID